MIDLPGFGIVGEVGRGATGVVYRALDLTLRRVVAVKVPLPGPDAEREVKLASLLREARIQASLKSPGIPELHHVCEHQGQPYLIREFVRGETLEHHVRSRTIQSSDGVRALGTIAATLVKVHAHGIQHRNLQPSNILIAADGSAKLIGFSRSKVLDDSSPPDLSALAAIDVEALQAILDWLFFTLKEPMPAWLHPLRTGNHVASPADFANRIAQGGVG